MNKQWCLSDTGLSGGNPPADTFPWGEMLFFSLATSWGNFLRGKGATVAAMMQSGEPESAVLGGIFQF